MKYSKCGWFLSLSLFEKWRDAVSLIKMDEYGGGDGYDLKDR
ncbi:hypothetical protein DFA_01373 [Cavenderia fasciculata]|uniref:Uncharacterized protein n=1 Tax=Cavenderia fasciculata TaxID=261658 RepID=F4PSF7_CACFS|nr:uncharacterized protein DFA_01373 [Cavenderia fasciculata]EGG21487.1 hypothetical protein DFA_01373 [Cavenderia fasciculata]|eukprot:XP_004359337.1 hypothetical protein DFA_01373 [Cavenderia fasciculata]